jgi:hypothetical protein
LQNTTVYCQNRLRAYDNKELTSGAGANVRRYQPRISLLTAFLLITIAGLAIDVALQWHELRPLRADNRRMRDELGYLNIDDPTKAYAIQLKNLGDEPWKWRIYLPPGGKYQLCCFKGHPLPAAMGLQERNWSAAVKAQGGGVVNMGSGLEGEFMVEARLEKKGRLWTLHFTPGGSTSVYQASSESENNDEPAVVGNLGEKQEKFEPADPILLLHLAKPMVTKLSNGNTTSETPEGPADGVVLWIEQQPSAVTTTKPNAPTQ